MKDMSLTERLDFTMQEYRKLALREESAFSYLMEPENEEDLADPDRRRLQGDVVFERQSATFDGTEFFFNAQAERGGEEKRGIFTHEFPFDDIIVQNSYFHDNEYGDLADEVGDEWCRGKCHGLVHVHLTCMLCFLFTERLRLFHGRRQYLEFERQLLH